MLVLMMVIPKAFRLAVHLVVLLDAKRETQMVVWMVGMKAWKMAVRTAARKVES